MDIGYIPAPPPEEFEESVPLPSGSEWDDAGNGNVPYTTTNYSSPAASSGVPTDNGAAWQRARDALNQSQPSATATMTPYGQPSYANPYAPSMMPAPSWPQPSYGYASNYSGYPTAPSGMYAGGQFNHGQGLGYQRPPPSYGGPQQPVQRPPSPQKAPEPAPSAQSYYVPPPQTTSSVSSTITSFPPRVPQNSFGRVRQARPRYAPYPTAPQSSSSSSSGQYGQQAVGSVGAPYQAYQSSSGMLPPLDSTASFSSDKAGRNGVVDMETEDAERTSLGFADHYPQNKQAPGAGGIRFQLSKKSPAEVKVSNPLLQRRPLLPSPGRPTATITVANGPNSNYSSFSSSSSSSAAGQPSTAPQTPDLLSNVQSKDWPASLQGYVTKAIRITPPEKHEQVMHTITQMITTAYKTNTLFTAKWESAPMPYATEAANELFGLSPKRENESPPPSSHSSSFASRSRFTPSSSRGRNAANTRRGRVTSGRRSNSESGGDEDEERYINYGSKYGAGSSRAHPASSKWDDNGAGKEKSTSPELDFLPIRGGASKSSSASTGKKGKLNKQGKGSAGPPGPRGKLMGFGVEPPKSAEDLEKLRKREARFSATIGDSPGMGVKKAPIKPKKSMSKSPGRATNGLGPRRALSTIRTVVGTCQTVEKEYFRLTEAVDASQVRPVNILQEALQMVKEKWKKEHNYRYAESQLKSIRQDLRVQHIFSPFTVQVYETHARIALEVGDQAEFTQCLSQLEWLYDTLGAVHRGAESTHYNSGDVPVSRSRSGAVGCENRLEFLSYRILYVMRQNKTTDVTRVRTQLSEEDKKDTCIAFAFSVLSAYFAGDYEQFFSLYKIAPLMAGYVMEVSVPQFRQRIFIKICTAYRPNLPVSALKEILRFSNDAELRSFLQGYKGLVYTWMNELEEIDCKASLPAAKAGPEPVDAAGASAAKPKPVSMRPTSKTRRKVKA